MNNLLFLLLFIPVICFSKINCETVVNKVIMIGDSWSNFPLGFGTFSKNLNRFGFDNIGVFSNNSTLSKNGAETSYFLSSNGIKAVQDAFKANPNIQIVNLSIGGNDILNRWNKNMDSLTSERILNLTINRIDSIISIIKKIKPAVKIYMPGYDYSNFGEIIQTYSDPEQHVFYPLWNGMGKPTFFEINRMLTRLSDKFTQLANKHADVYFNNALGLMQYVYGQTTALAVPPGGVYPPKTVLLPGGKLDYPSPKISMRDYGFITDCFHLSSEGFDEFYKYHFNRFYFLYFRGINLDTTLFSTGKFEDGYVSSNLTFNTSSIALGNTSSSDSNKGIVSFNTAGLSVRKRVYGAHIFLYRDSLQGNLSDFKKLYLEIKKEHFGNTSKVELIDYKSPADQGDTTCAYGTVSENGYWIRISVPKSFLSEINSGKNIQFRISTTDTVAGKIYFSTGDTLNKPFLDIDFSNLSDNQKKITDQDLLLYPNPTNSDFIYIKNLNSFDNITVRAFDLYGRKVLISYEEKNHKIDISKLTQGQYFLIFSNNKIKIVRHFVKI